MAHEDINGDDYDVAGGADAILKIANVLDNVDFWNQAERIWRAVGEMYGFSVRVGPWAVRGGEEDE